MSNRAPVADGRPPPLDELELDRITDLDVRPLLRSGHEPFEKILAVVRSLPPDGVLRLRAIFEPRPLYAVMAREGFHHWTEELGPEDWRVWFWRPEGTSADPGTRELPIRDEQSEDSEQSEDVKMTAKHGPYLLDVRELDGPDKHPTIHTMFDDLGPGQALTIVNDHQPKPLYHELKAERTEHFDDENYRAYEAGDRVWVAVIPKVTGSTAV